MATNHLQFVVPASDGTPERLFLAYSRQWRLGGVFMRLPSAYTYDPNRAPDPLLQPEYPRPVPAWPGDVFAADGTPAEGTRQADPATVFPYLPPQGSPESINFAAPDPDQWTFAETADNVIDTLADCAQFDSLTLADLDRVNTFDYPYYEYYVRWYNTNGWWEFERYDSPYDDLKVLRDDPPSEFFIEWAIAFHSWTYSYRVYNRTGTPRGLSVLPLAGLLLFGSALLLCPPLKPRHPEPF